MKKLTKLHLFKLKVSWIDISEHAIFFLANFAIASFVVVQIGTFVSCSTGNSGPNNTTTTNLAPWVLTVGACATDRNIKATAKLGNQMEFDDELLFQPKDFPPFLML